ncbi:hypothetical protein OfM1_21600 [Lactovum odontotermitis]
MTNNLQEKNNSIDIEMIANRAYKWNLTVTILCIVWFLLLILSVLIPVSPIAQGVDLLVFIYAIVAHVRTRKLKIVSVGPILIYGDQIIGVILAVLVHLNSLSSGAKIFVAFSSLLLHILAAVFCYRTARKINEKYRKKETQ